MPTLANITVKKNDGTTDIVWTGVVPSSGDKSAAVWKSQTVGTASAHQPELRMTGRESGDTRKRLLKVTAKYPQIATNSTTGVTSVVDEASFAADWVVPKGMPASDVNEFASQIGNLIASTLLKQCVKEGYAAS